MLTVRRSKGNGENKTKGEKEINNLKSTKSRDAGRKERKHTGSR